MMQTPLIRVAGLEVEIRQDDGAIVKPVNGISFEIATGTTLALVGESGSGKSMTALALMGLLPPNARQSGEIVFDGRVQDRAATRCVRGREIVMIFQEPMTALTPVLTVERQLTEALVEHRLATREEARERALGNLRRVELPEPKTFLPKYPFQLSGGQRQRVMIAMALMGNPKLLIADEPTTALDVTIQAQILELLRGLQHDLGLTIMLITHDMGVVARMAHMVAVMYAGELVEQAPVDELFARPRHPYTAHLLSAIPRLRGHREVNQ